MNLGLPNALIIIIKFLAFLEGREHPGRGGGGWVSARMQCSKPQPAFFKQYPLSLCMKRKEEEAMADLM